jgi:hypothetical protein
MANKLMLHAGAHHATLEEVLDVTTPEPTDTHFPIPHNTLIDSVVGNLEGIGLTVKDADYGLWGDDGEMMFAVMSLQNGNSGMAQDDYETILGLRNAHNKRFSAGLACGSRVFVCDNLAMSGDVVVFRKHTKFIMRDLDRLLFEALGRLHEAKIAQDLRIANYKATPLTDSAAHDVLIRSVDAQVMANATIAKVLKEWREPTFEDFDPRTAWSLFNSFTQVLKEGNPLDLTRKTTRLHGLLDLVVEATENRGLVDDLVNGRAILPAVEVDHGVSGLIGTGEVQDA